jgi:nucleoside phosphorylase
VTVASRFEETATGGVFDANPALLALARRAARDVDLERCTVPLNRTQMVCFPKEPRMRVGGVGQSADPFGSSPLVCDPDGGPVFGCDATEPAATHAMKSDQPVAEDMETAAVARVATAHGVPWVGIRGVSDGAGDPLGLPGFPAQFFAYYPISAHNAAVGAAALLGRLARIAETRHADDPCDLLAARRWKRAVRRLHAR